MTIAGGLITLNEAKASLGIPTTVTKDDSDIERYIEAATPVIEDIVGPVLPRTITRQFAGGRSAILLPNEAAVIQSVTDSGSAVTDYTFDTHAKILYGPGVFSDGPLAVEVAYQAGFAVVPANINLATRELVRHWWQQGRQGNRPAFGDAGVSDVSVPSGFAVPRRVIELCEPNRRTEGFA